MKSMDIFDTLLGRWYYYPDSIFREIEETYTADGYQNFSWWRKHSEAESKLKTFDDIYQTFQTLTGCSDLVRDALKEFEFSLEKKRTFKIVNNSSRLDMNTILISDTYYGEDRLKDLLKHHGIVDYGGIVCSYDGKSSGRVWKNFKSEGHLGDNRVSDYEIPLSLGSDAILFDASLTENEKWLESNGFGNLAYLCRAVRLSNPFYGNNEKANLWFEQTQVNLPLLVLISNHLHENYKDSYRKFLFTMRDGCNLQKVFSLLYPYFPSDVFISSRDLYSSPTQSFMEYTEETVGEKDLIVDLQGTGKTFFDYFGNSDNYFTVIYSDLQNELNPKHLVHRAEGFSDRLERINYYEYTKYIDVYKTQAKRWVGINSGLSKYADLIRAQRLAIEKACEFIKNGFVLPKRSNDQLVRDFLNYLEKNCMVCEYINHEET